MRTIYIKPPAIKYARRVVECADISINTSHSVILALNDEAIKQNKVHEIIIMIELGELREGILRDHVVNFYSNILDLSNIKVIGLGTNLGCMYGVKPTFDKLMQLSLYKLLLEEKYEHRIPLLSGGSSINLPLVSMRKTPKETNGLLAP